MSGYGDDLVEAPWPPGTVIDPVSPEAEALHRELNRHLGAFLDRFGLQHLDHASAEQFAEYRAGRDQISARYGVPPLP